MVSALNFCNKAPQRNAKRVQIRVKVVPHAAAALNSFCIAFMRRRGDANLEYHGEGMSTVFNKALTYLFTGRRINPSPDTRAAIVAAQHECCALCGDRLGARLEFDHIEPLCLGGGSGVDELARVVPRPSRYVCKVFSRKKKQNPKAT